MGIRQTINENPAISAVVTGVIILVALIYIVVSIMPHHPKAGPPGQLFFTDDDGATWFPDLATKIPPYTDAKGNEAVLAYVYKCGQTGQSFVGYMMKYGPEGQRSMQQATTQPGGGMINIPPFAFTDTEVKQPGSNSEWVSQTQDPAAFRKITNPTCPNGGTELMPVNPNPAP